MEVGRVTIPFHWLGDPRPYTSPPRERIAKWVAHEEEEEDESFIREMLSMGPGAVFVEWIVMPLLGAALAAILALITCSALWAAVKLGLSIRDMMA